MKKKHWAPIIKICGLEQFGWKKLTLEVNLKGREPRDLVFSSIQQVFEKINKNEFQQM